MMSSQPIWIVKGAENWQIFARTGEVATLFLEGGFRPEDAPGTIYVRVVSEEDGHPIVPWTETEQTDEAWSVTVSIPTGGPYRLETCAKQPHTEFKDAIGGQMRLHLFVGDIYLIAGQSNGAGYARDEFNDPPCVGVGVYRLGGYWDLATHPLNDGTDCCFANLDVPLPAHSPWLTFAKTLFRKTGVPIGLLPAALGGSPMEVWMPGQILYRNAMDIVRHAGLPKGVLWYQGCSDAIAGNAKDYKDRFLQMVDAMRKELGNPALPFFTCQLNGFTEPDTPASDAAWAELRRQQSLCAEVDGVYMLPTAGMKLYDQIHNCTQSNIRIGRQIAAQALANLYDQNLRWRSPRVSRILRGADGLEIRFSDLEGGIRMKRTAKLAFCAYEKGRPLEISKCTANYDRILLEGPELNNADLVTYGQTQNMTNAGIFDIDGDWAVEPFSVYLSPVANQHKNITIREA